jgi:hypothetical protein
MSNMRHQTVVRNTTRARPQDVASGYHAARARVADAHRRMREVEAGPHTPGDARTASHELNAALREAKAMVTRTLQQPGLDTTRRVSPDVAAWSAELVRLSELDVWLRRTTLDDLGVHVPTTVRVGCRAANGPHIAGMVADPDDLVAATLHDPRIGIDLQSVVDHAQGGS